MSESTGLMEPMAPPAEPSDLEDKILTLTGLSRELAGNLHPVTRLALARLVRSMNCYYSNLIEGHNTHPREIDRALQKNYSAEPEKRSLQKEAIAHIEVQKMIDEGHDPLSFPLTLDYARWLHYEFCSRLPDDFLWVIRPSTKEKLPVVPGEFRKHEVEVGLHLPPLVENLPRFVDRFDKAYQARVLGSSVRAAMAIPAAHHRFLWIHPFLDGNGRVARLMSYAAFLKLGIGNPLWSIARGLARRVDEYKQHLAACDGPRAGDLDGRGTLSQQALLGFTAFFLDVCIDQVRYMGELLQPLKLSERIRYFVEDEMSAGRLEHGSFQLLREALIQGEFDRGRASDITGFKTRKSQQLLSTLVKRGLLVSDTPKGAVRLGFPFEVLGRWFPALYPITD